VRFVTLCNNRQSADITRLLNADNRPKASTKQQTELNSLSRLHKVNWNELNSQFVHLVHAMQLIWT